MTGFDDLPLELKQEILRLCLPGIDHARFRRHVGSELTARVNLRQMQNFINAFGQAQSSILKKLFKICKSWSRALITVMQWYIKDIERYIQTVLDVEMAEISHQFEYRGPFLCTCCGRVWDCFVAWKLYWLQHRKDVQKIVDSCSDL